MFPTHFGHDPENSRTSSAHPARLCWSFSFVNSRLPCNTANLFWKAELLQNLTAHQFDGRGELESYFPIILFLPPFPVPTILSIEVFASGFSKPCPANCFLKAECSLQILRRKQRTLPQLSNPETMFRVQKKKAILILDCWFGKGQMQESIAFLLQIWWYHKEGKEPHCCLCPTLSVSLVDFLDWRGRYSKHNIPRGIIRTWKISGYPEEWNKLTHYLSIEKILFGEDVGLSIF